MGADELNNLGILTIHYTLSKTVEIKYKNSAGLYNFLLFSSPVLQALKDEVIKECVVGPRHVAFLLEV